MSETASPTAVTYDLEDAGISRQDRNRLLWDIEQIGGVTYAEFAGDPETSAFVYVGLANGRSFDADDTPNPLSSPDSDEYDPDGVRHALLEIEYEWDIECAPSAMYMHDDTVEYAVPFGAEPTDRDTIRPPRSRQGNISLAAVSTPRERARAYFRSRETENVTPADAPGYTADVRDAVDYLNEDEAREAFATVYGFDVDDLPYGDFRDAPEDVQAAHAQDMANLAALNRRMAERLQEYNPKRAQQYRQEAISLDCTLASMPDEWLETEEFESEDISDHYPS